MASRSDAPDGDSDRQTPVEDPFDRISTLRPPPLERTTHDWNLLLGALGDDSVPNREHLALRRFGLAETYLPFLCEIRTALTDGDSRTLTALYHRWIGAV